MPNYTPLALLKRYDGKPDVHSRAIRMICDVAMRGVGLHIAFHSRRNRDILRVLMANTGWNMVLVGNIPNDVYSENEYDVGAWAEVIDIAAEAELEDRAPRVDKVMVCSDGILVRFKPGTSWVGSPSSRKIQTRLQKAIAETARTFSEYDGWGQTPLRPVIAEESS